MINKICLFFVLLFQSVVLFAVPADSRLRQVLQKDGTILLVSLRGDELYHYYVTEDGFPILEENGGWYYATCDDEEIVSSMVLAHNEKERSEIESTFLARWQESTNMQSLETCIMKRWSSIITTANERRLRCSPRRMLGEPTPYKGKKKGLVLLVDFANVSMVEEDSNAFYDEMFNKSGYSQNGHVGSVHDYFNDQSYGIFDLSFDVIGPLKLSNNYGYYGSDGISASHGSDKHPDEMVREACQLADSQVDFKKYDWDGDGEVDQVFIIYAGYGQATGGYANTIWPHESELRYFPNGVLELDGVTINKYACSNELYGNNGKEHMGIGVACHEFSHCLGLPDTYDTDYSGGYGMGYWGVMCSGSYNGPKGIGEVPCGFSAFERWYAGWLEFTDITSSHKTLVLPDLESSPQAYRIFNEGNSNEFYTFENRQASKWFRYVNTYVDIHGMLVTHIDYDKNAWQSNDVNQLPKHQRMTIIPADCSYGSEKKDIIGDLFPGQNEITELTNTSHADYGGQLFNTNKDGSNYMNVGINEIRESENYILFDVVFNEELSAPSAFQVAIEDTQCTLSWSDVAADSYTIQIKKIYNENPVRIQNHTEETIAPQYSFTVDGLTLLQYKVRSNKGNLHSEWSEVNTVNVLASNIQHSPIDGTNIIYHTIDGKKCSILLTKGMYINGENHKIQIIK